LEFKISKCHNGIVSIKYNKFMANTVCRATRTKKKTGPKTVQVKAHTRSTPSKRKDVKLYDKL
jgi:hypothetical protein